jgi:hypothetical protein
MISAATLIFRKGAVTIITNHMVLRIYFCTPLYMVVFYFNIVTGFAEASFLCVRYGANFCKLFFGWKFALTAGVDNLIHYLILPSFASVASILSVMLLLNSLGLSTLLKNGWWYALIGSTPP